MKIKYISENDFDLPNVMRKLTTSMTIITVCMCNARFCNNFTQEIFDI